MADPRFKAPTIDRRLMPERFVRSEICIESREDLEQAVHALRWLRTSQAEIDEALTRQTIPLQQQAEHLKRLQCTDDDVERSFEDLDKLISEAVTSYVNRQRKTLFDGDARTVKLHAGEVSLRSTPLAITHGKLSKARITEKICGHFDVLGKIVDYALKLGVRPWLKLKAELDVTSIKQAYNQGEIDDAQLKELGLKAETTEKVDVKTYA